MAPLRTVLILCCTLFFILTLTVENGAAATCQSLLSLKLSDTVLTVAQPFAAGEFRPPNGAGPVPVAFCRVVGKIRPTSDSDIGFEVWLPTAGWTGRFQSVGSQGFAGSIRYGGMWNPLLAGTAVASTDDGNTTGDGVWALGHPEKIIDFGYRAVHLTAEIGKAITTAFYETKPHHSYFVGCSKGGQEALMEAQRFPMDFDGILGGASANQLTRLVSSYAWTEKLNQTDKSSYISPAEVEKIGAATIAACDALDGVKDGLISDPLKCKVSSSMLPLTEAQAKTFDALHAGPQNSAGKSLYMGQAFGAEDVGWRTNITGPSFEQASRSAQTAYANIFFANFVYQDPTWNFRRFDIDKSPDDAEKAVGQILNAESLDLSEFERHGGKLLQWHGWADSLITPLGSIDYYERVTAAQQVPAKTQDFYRLFLAPGVDHCGQGPGPNQFGNAGGNGDPDHDIVAALYQWVENGTAPDRIIATKFMDNDPAKGEAMTRPLCPYPQVARYKGTGDTNSASNFICSVR